MLGRLHSSHVLKLKVAELNALLAFKAIEIPKGSKKPELVKLAKTAHIGNGGSFWGTSEKCETCVKVWTVPKAP